ncbi:MAG: Re/Si-specific NAD(P)(+) transhydrogenase subunit alpha [Alphaproteobacteria bacterium]|nr:Re/Si-specific NAD(P)(+) transhydrogenase subunit alpha [Alphaproteobacteria bacterium]
MKIGVLKERVLDEKRVAVSPSTVKSFVDMGFKVCIEKDAGIESGFSDEDFENAGASVSKIPLEILSDADIVLKVQPSPQNTKNTELSLMKEGAIIVGMLSPFDNRDLFKEYSKKGIDAFSMELVPRITRAQSMDVLSSQSNLAGYRSVIEAAYEYGKIFPMMITAAGTVTPTRVLILGAGVAGLQAIATAKRMGAIVSVFDVRSAAKEQVESVGGTFIEVEGSEDFETKGGYAKETDEEYKRKQSELIHKEIKRSDIVICTALIPGRKAPILVPKAMVDDMKIGSVIVDLAAINGGNCEVTDLNKVAEYNNVKVIGYSNYASRAASDASTLYAKNLLNFVKLLYDAESKSIKVNMEDEILKSSAVTSGGYMVSEKEGAL